MLRGLTISGGFTVDDGHHRHLDQQARRLGFADLRGCLQALLDDGWSIPQLATHLDTTQAVIRRAIADHQVRQLPRRQQLARQRQHTALQRAATRMAELGSAGVSSAARHAWPSSASPRWRNTCGTAMSAKAGRCGGCALSWGWAMAGWTSSCAGSGCAADLRSRMAVYGWRSVSKPVG